ncbi:MAG: 50S ribosomal protein L23 [Phycisphaerales bacterium JB037]
MHPTYVIRKPVLTEKSTAMAEENTYAFEVDRRSNKDEIKAAIEELYGVRVENVRTLMTKGRRRRLRYGWVNGGKVKKAMVRLAEGESIDLF